MIIKALITTEFEVVYLRSAEIRNQEALGERVDHVVLRFWEKKLSNHIEEILNRVLVNLEQMEYSETLVDSTMFTNKKENDWKYRQ